MDKDELRKIASKSIDREKLLERLNLTPIAKLKQEKADDRVWIEYVDSPIRVINSDGKAHSLEINLKDGISAKESFPATSNEGKYTLELKKNVVTAENVQEVFDELLVILRDLSLCWPFSGGSKMDLRSMTVNYVPKYKSNCEELKTEMLKRRGHSRLSHSINLVSEIIGTYSNFPLKNAIIILNSANTDFHLRLMLEYYLESHLDKRYWFIHLYKIRDSLVRAALKHKPSQNRFSISLKDWRRFGSLLNLEYNLRHAPKKEQPIPVFPVKDKEFVFGMGRKMILNYLDFLSVPHV